MGVSVSALVDKLRARQSLSLDEYEALIASRTPQLSDELAEHAREVCEAVYGNAVFVRGLIELSNYCDNNCLYCGIRRDSMACERYRLSLEDVLDCVDLQHCIGQYNEGVRNAPRKVQARQILGIPESSTRPSSAR